MATEAQKRVERDDSADEETDDSESSLRPSESASQVTYHSKRRQSKSSTKRVAQPPASKNATPLTPALLDESRPDEPESFVGEPVTSYRPYLYKSLHSWRSRYVEEEVQRLRAYCEYWRATQLPIYPPVEPKVVLANISEAGEVYKYFWHSDKYDEEWRDYRRRLFRQLSDQLYDLGELLSLDRTFECQVCMEKHRGRRFPEFVTESCEHGVSLCKPCLEQWTTAQLDTKGWKGITCPEPSCGRLLNKEDVKWAADSQTYAKYKKFRFREEQTAHPDFTFCLSPDCENGQIHNTRRSGSKMTCNECSFRTCVKHKVPWHKRQTCKEYDAELNNAVRKKQEVASEDWKTRSTRMCPSCSAPIDKISGCNAMSCGACKRPFQWHTAKQYGGGDPVNPAWSEDMGMFGDLMEGMPVMFFPGHEDIFPPPPPTPARWTTNLRNMNTGRPGGERRGEGSARTPWQPETRVRDPRLEMDETARADEQRYGRILPPRGEQREGRKAPYPLRYSTRRTLDESANRRAENGGSPRNREQDGERKRSGPRESSLTDFLIHTAMGGGNPIVGSVLGAMFRPPRGSGRER